MLLNKRLPIDEHLQFYGGQLDVRLILDELGKPRLAVWARRDVFVAKTKTYKAAGNRIDVTATGVQWTPGTGILRGSQHAKDLRCYNFPCETGEGVVLDWGILVLVRDLDVRHDRVIAVNVTIDAPADSDFRNGDSRN